jgi:hypothetical protein
MRLLVALLLGVACAVVVACGDDGDEGLLSSARAERLDRRLDAVADAVSASDCEQAAAAVRRLQDEVAGLPQATDPELVDRLQEGVDNLRTQAGEECQDQTDTTTTETAPPPTDTTTTETTETAPPPTETAPPTDTAPPPEEEDPPVTQPPDEPPPEEEDPTGGAQPGQGDGG